MEKVVWPGSVLALAAAITFAEGSKLEWNNPGDLTYSCGFPTRGIVNSDGVLAFVYKEDGEYALCHQCWLMLTGKSHIYRPEMTLIEVGLLYSNRNQYWAINVASKLGVARTETLAQIAERKWVEAA